MSHSKFTPRNGATPPPLDTPRSRDDEGVIPIRGHTPAAPSGAIGRKEAELSPLVESVPIEARPWRILHMPPTSGEATRALSVARWQRFLVFGLLVALVTVAVAAVTTLSISSSSPDIFAPSADLAAIRGRLVAVEDSLSKARQALDVAEDINNGPRANRNLLPDVRGRILSAVGAPSMAGLSVEGLPVTGTITSDYSSSRLHPLLHIIRPHLGVDIMAPRGSRISAPAAGRVSFVGWRISLGLLVEIEHPNGIMTRYAHCRMALVKVGDDVTRGAMIATVGSSGLTTGPHLHYEVWDHGNVVDPLRFRFPQPPDTTAAAGTREN